MASGSMLVDVQGFYDSILDVRNPESVVITSVSLAPFTSIVSVDQVRERLKGLEGVEVEERVYALVSVNNSSLILAGLVSKSLKKVVSTTDNCMLCSGCVFVGEDIARELNISPGMEIVVYSPYTSLPYILHVCGFARGWPYSWMLISNLATARTIRGMGEYQASVVIVRSSAGVEAVLNAVGLSPYLKSVGERVILAIKSYGRNISVKIYSTYAGEALDRLGIPEAVFYATVIAICTALAVSASMLGGFIIGSRAREVAVLRMFGASSKDVKISLITITLIYTLLSSILSGLLLPIIPLRLTLLGIPISPTQSPAILAVGTLLIWAFTSIGIAGEEVVE